MAGINALGRGQDRESLAQFLTVLAQTLGPEAIGQFVNPDEVIKRLAAASGIDVLNLVKSMQEKQAEQQQQMAQQQQMMAMQQAPQMAAVEQKRRASCYACNAATDATRTTTYHPNNKWLKHLQ